MIERICTTHSKADEYHLNLPCMAQKFKKNCEKELKWKRWTRESRKVFESAQSVSGLSIMEEICENGF